MKEFKGTPGPWYVEDGALGNETLIVLSDNFPFKMMSKENRDLITAAPELLEALQALTQAIDYGTSMDVSQAQEVAQDVIAKAMGE